MCLSAVKHGARTFRTAHCGTAAHINHSPLKCCDELTCPHVTLQRMTRGEIQGGWWLTRGTWHHHPSAWQATQQRKPGDSSRQAPHLLKPVTPLLPGVAQHRPEKHKEFYHKLLLYVLHWLTWFPSYLWSARLLIHPFRLMNYTTKKIGALDCYGACKRVKIPFLWQVAIKILKEV